MIFEITICKYVFKYLVQLVTHMLGNMKKLCATLINELRYKSKKRGQL